MSTSTISSIDGLSTRRQNLNQLFMAQALMAAQQEAENQRTQMLQASLMMAAIMPVLQSLAKLFSGGDQDNVPEQSVDTGNPDQSEQNSKKDAVDSVFQLLQALSQLARPDQVPCESDSHASSDGLPAPQEQQPLGGSSHDAPSGSVESGAGPSKTGPTKMPEPTEVVIVNETIHVKPGETFDGHGKLFKAGPKLGNGGDSEDQKSLFDVGDGATLQNLQIEGADGVHTFGDATINNVWWRDVGEDALTMKKSGNVTVNGGGAYQAADKIFQLNAGGSFTLNNFDADTFGKLIRQNGGSQDTLDIHVNNGNFRNGHMSVVTTDSSTTTITLDNNKTSNMDHALVKVPNANHVSGTSDITS